MTRNINFLKGCSWFKFNNLGLAIGMALNFYTSVVKWIKLRVRKIWELIFTFAEGTWEKRVGKPSHTLSPSRDLVGLITLGLTAAEAAANTAIHKKMFGSSNKTLVISSEEMNDIMKIVKSLELKMKQENKKEDFSECF